jgi:hypothetical protein
MELVVPTLIDPVLTIALENVSATSTDFLGAWVIALWLSERNEPYVEKSDEGGGMKDLWGCFSSSGIVA